jgi:hypothetical protein
VQLKIVQTRDTKAPVINQFNYVPAVNHFAKQFIQFLLIAALTF